ncbi:unnamed protein product [Macrosiphum euphorbiae]|uniref:Uncharacterized protein n=1 Tax=Macrosiphum euphorbiae TaxID=13131 RepID=A0AAV0XW70_9HEMI|nr:unnamed protein product [Macrosiphum euphorbiae]
MASVINVPANEASRENVYINSAASTAVTSTNAPITTNNTQTNQDKLPKDCEDVESLKGRFSWKLIDGYHVPYIIRVINGEQLKFVSVRMAQTQLLSKYLHTDILYTCTSVRCYLITKSEAILLNYINQDHTECLYGKQRFLEGKEYIMSLEDAHEFYTFIEACYEKILCNITPGRIEKCGFIRINNSEFAVPYCIIDNQKYVPLFYFEGETTENLKHRPIKLENWNLAYLKFCFKVMGIKNELYAGDFCTTINFEDIINNFPPETTFEEFWPANMANKFLLINQKSTHVNSLGSWIRAPAEVEPAEDTIAHPLTAPAPLPPSIPVMINTSYQNGWPADQMVPTMSQGSSLVNIADRTQQPYSGQPVHLRNFRPVVTVQQLEVTAVSSPPSSLVPPAVPLNPLRPNIPERTWACNTSKNAAYKIQKVKFQGRVLHCINAKPYIYSDLMVILHDFVKTVLPMCSVKKCASVLNTYLKTELFYGNSEQLAVLRENGLLRAMYPDETQMASLKDVRQAWPQLKELVLKNDEELQRYQAAAAAAGGPAKRQRTS